MRWKYRKFAFHDDEFPEASYYVEQMSNGDIVIRNYRGEIEQHSYLGKRLTKRRAIRILTDYLFSVIEEMLFMR